MAFSYLYSLYEDNTFMIKNLQSPNKHCSKRYKMLRWIKFLVYRLRNNSVCLKTVGFYVI